ncbi:hypothetical protein [Rhodoferax sp.]|uniref:hypothetical protein n=1 Tax=Rhodoferax sp. TaxID=50421 RepID=UPI00374C9C73
MSFLNWFSRKSTPAPLASTLPLDGAAPQGDQTARLRDERIDRRERLYGVVRESLLQAGVLTASFKFKVLALDEHGQQFLVMVDLAPPWGGETEWRTTLEDEIIHTAQTRHKLTITSVYWRNNVELAAPPVSVPAPLASPAPVPPAAFAPTEPGTLTASGRYEPLQADEVAAFQQALEAASRAPSAPSSVPGKVHQGKQR